jgi:hypothetical protein
MQSSSTTTVDQPVAKHLAPIIIESYGRAYRVHAPDLHLDSAKFCLVIEGMGAGSRYWTKVAYATSAIPDVLRTIAEKIKGRGYSVILRT